MLPRNNSTIQAEISSLWELLKDNNISMPLYQRDYVQGRIGTKDDPVELIRKEFVEDLIGALVRNEKIELHFIFGGRDSNRDAEDDFVPVDGQQRLTALFLLHWFVFLKSGADMDERNRLNKFQYKSRKTSDVFCKRLVSLLEDTTCKIAECKDIEDCAWFTGNIESDPTVMSMLVVLKEFEAQFNRLDIGNWLELKARLIGEDCPITFLRLDMQNELGADNEIRDLYIKMNDRGKQLTDFENFKAYLHKKIPEERNEFDLLGEYLKSIRKADTEAERIKLLGKINNEYTDFFFRIINKGEIRDNSCSDAPPVKGEANFDTAMMNYFNEMIRMAFYKRVRKDNVSEKLYSRAHGTEIAKMGGKAFYRFITSSASKYTKEYGGLPEQSHARAAILEGFTEALELLDIFIDNEANFYEAEDPVLNTYSPLQLVKETANLKSSTLLAASRAIFSFVKKFGLRKPDDKLFSAWYGLVWRCLKFTEFEGFSDACVIGGAFEEIINIMPEKDSCQISDLWEAVVKLGTAKTSTLFEHHFKEERIKAELLLKDQSTWTPLIDEAVSWNWNGQIYYLFELSKEKDEEDNDCYSPDNFREYYNLFNEIFDRTKERVFVIKGNEEIRRTFENALLISKSPDPNLPYYHLCKIGNGSQMHFLYNNYNPVLETLASDKEELLGQRSMFLDFLRALKNRSESTFEEKLKGLFAERQSGAFDADLGWRKCFLDEDLYFLDFLERGETPDAAIHLTADGYYLLYQGGKQRHSMSTEIHTAVLYQRLIGSHKSPILKSDNKDVHWDKDADTEKPFRYLTCDDITVYYCNDGFYVLDDPAETKYDLDGIVKHLTTS
jgi:hypothetical protein